MLQRAEMEWFISTKFDLYKIMIEITDFNHQIKYMK